MSRYKPYPAYKESDVEWSNKFPSHWSIKPIYAIAKLRNGFPFASDQFVQVGDAKDRLIRIRDISSDDAAIYTEEECSPSARISNGDLIIGMDGDFNVHLWGRGCAKLNQRVCALSGKDKDITAFLSFCLPAPLKVINDVTFFTTVKHLSSYAILHEKILVPPAHEMKNLVEHLKLETTRIDALIEKKTRFIELLKEKRQALITHAVTKGIDPHAPMKDSGVEWIGEVPEHWTLPPLKLFNQIGNGSTPSRTNDDYWLNGVFPWLNSSMVNHDQVKAADQYVTLNALKECHLPVIKPPAVLVGITGQGRTRGMSTTLQIEATINQHVAFIKPLNDRLSSKYLKFFMDAVYGWLRIISGGSGSTKGAITCQQIANLKLTLPNIDEQDQVTSYLSSKLKGDR